MAEDLILTEQEVKIFNRAGLLYGLICFVFVVLLVWGWNSYFADAAALQQEETRYALQQEEANRLHRFINSTRSDTATQSQSLNAVTGD